MAATRRILLKNSIDAPFGGFFWGTETLPQATIVDPRAILKVEKFSITLA